MTRLGARWLGTVMTAGATLLLLGAHGILAPEPVLASECCQVCEAKEAACYAACEESWHGEGEDDSLNACYDTCDYELYDGAHACWAHCTYCSPPDPKKCFAAASWHSFGECLFYWGGMCAYYQVFHHFELYQVSSGHCTS